MRLAGGGGSTGARSRRLFAELRDGQRCAGQPDHLRRQRRGSHRLGHPQRLEHDLGPRRHAGNLHLPGPREGDRDGPQQEPQRTRQHDRADIGHAVVLRGPLHADGRPWRGGRRRALSRSRVTCRSASIPRGRPPIAHRGRAAAGEAGAAAEQHQPDRPADRDGTDDALRQDRRGAERSAPPASFQIDFADFADKNTCVSDELGRDAMRESIHRRGVVGPGAALLAVGLLLGAGGLRARSPAGAGPERSVRAGVSVDMVTAPGHAERGRREPERRAAGATRPERQRRSRPTPCCSTTDGDGTATPRGRRRTRTGGSRCSRAS